LARLLPSVRIHRVSGCVGLGSISALLVDLIPYSLKVVGILDQLGVFIFGVWARFGANMRIGLAHFRCGASHQIVPTFIALLLHCRIFISSQFDST
jgi:hypothetical protein